MVTLRLAVAQTFVPEDPADPGAIRKSGAEARALMRAAREGGASLVQFPEGTLIYPGKRLISSTGPDRVGPADWSRLDWGILRDEARAIAALAGELGVWTVFGAPHQLTPPNRPHNSMYVVSPAGALATRYDKRRLSHTELTWMYTPGTEPTTFTAGETRLGVAACIEAAFPALFEEYERLDADAVLLSMMVDAPIRATVAQAYAEIYSLWIGYSTPAQFSYDAPAGIIAPGGHWIARCPADGIPAIAIANLDPEAGYPGTETALRHARPWRRQARNGLYEPLIRDDPRSVSRGTF